MSTNVAARIREFLESFKDVAPHVLANEFQDEAAKLLRLMTVREDNPMRDERERRQFGQRGR